MAKVPTHQSLSKQFGSQKVVIFRINQKNQLKTIFLTKHQLKSGGPMAKNDCRSRQDTLPRMFLRKIHRKSRISIKYDARINARQDTQIPDKILIHARSSVFSAGNETPLLRGCGK